MVSAADIEAESIDAEADRLFQACVRLGIRVTGDNRIGCKRVEALIGVAELRERGTR